MGAFKELAAIVKESPEKAVTPVAAPSMDGPIGAAAKKLAVASYPMLQKIDWASTGVLDKYVTNTPANKAGISALLDAGLAMDPKVIASAPPAKIKAVFDAVPNVQGLNVDWFSTMSVPDAVKSYQAFLETAAAMKAR